MKQVISIEVRFSDGTNAQVEGERAAAIWEWINSTSRTEMCHCGANFPGGLGIERMQLAS
jgi:hypothetical protein